MLRIRLVGELRVEVDGRTLDSIASRRARSLLAWMAYHPGLHPRTRVASVFWPDVLETSARASLRTTLTMLRRALGDHADIVVAGRDRVGIEDGPGLWVDVREAARRADAGDGDAALALLDGDLLTDLDDDWALEERRAHRDRVVGLLARLGDGAAQAGDLESALRHARRRSELDPLSEEAARVLMRRLAQTGDRAAAVAAYEAFRAVLRRELGMAPSADTRALVDELRAPARAAEAGADARQLPLPGPLAASEPPPLVGRREQLAALRAAWRRARAGAAMVVLLEGEAGSGKTRLLIELAREARSDDASILAGRCMEDSVTAFAPFTEALRPVLADSPVALPGWVATELARLLPELDPEARAPGAEPQAARHRLFEAVAAAIGQIARQRPVLLVVEDLHWADVATLRMLAHVISTVGWAPLLVAVSLRDEDPAAGPALHDLLADLRRAGRLERVTLGALSDDEAADLAALWLGDRPPSRELTATVLARTGGNPLFVEELVRHLVEVHAGRPAAALVAAAERDVPSGVRAVIDRRLGRLTEPAALAVRVAATAGEDFTLADVAAACETSDDALAGELEAVVGAGLVDELGVAGHYRFAHALIREAVLAGCKPTRRALLHRRMAEVLDALPAPRRERRINDLARHLLDARPLVDAARAARVALAAAEQATRRLAYEDAAELLDRALAGDLDEHDPLRAEILLALGEARLRAADGPAADRCFAAAADAARALADADLLARAALGAAGLSVNVAAVRERVRSLLEEALAGVAPDSPLRPRLLARLAIELYYEPPPTLRERLSAEALAAGRRTGGRALLEAIGARHVALWSPDHTEARLAIADELIAAARAAGDREAELQGINGRVADLFELGDRDRLLGSIDDHERLARELRLPAFDWYVPLWRSTLALFEDRVVDAQRLWEQGEAIGRAAGDENAALLFEVQRLGIRMAGREPTDEEDAAVRRRIEHSPASTAWRIGLAVRELARGRRDRARHEFERGMTVLDALPLDANWLYPVAVLGVMAARLRDGAAAAKVYSLLLPYGHRVVTVGRGCACAGSASLSLGLLATALDDRTAAVAHLEEAVRCNAALGGGAFVAFARHALADVLDDPVRSAALREEAERAAAAAAGLSLPDGLLWRL